MIVLVGAEKGGVGKSTIVTNLAVQRASEGRSVLVIDTDTQRSVVEWAAIRAEAELKPALTCISMYGKGISKEVPKLAPNYDDVIIDAGGRDSVELRHSMLIADVVLVPAQPSHFDIWGLAKVDQIVEECQGFNGKLRAFVIITRAPTNIRMTDTAELAEAVRSTLSNLQPCEAVLRERVAFKRAPATGQAVVELHTDALAEGEATALYDFVFKVKVPA